MIYYKDRNFNFFEIFNEKTGSLLRSNIIIDGKESRIPPSLRSFPELIDVGIMGSCHVATSGLCKSFGVDCYQNGHLHFGKNLPLEKFKLILEQSQGRVYQIVLGGAGDPIKHENFIEILKLTRQAHIVPNLTTTGFEMTDREAGAIRDYCGAVAVSFYTRIDSAFNEIDHISLEAIQKLLDLGCHVNTHYVLSNETISDAIYRLENHRFPSGIDSVIFLLYKAVGEGKKEKVIKAADSQYLQLLDLIDTGKFDFRIGFDTCQTPALRKFCSNIIHESVEPCEAGRFSMYIDSNFKAFPCSFACHDSLFNIDLNTVSLFEAWNSAAFCQFRGKQKDMCQHCKQQDCYGCALENAAQLCGFIKSQ